MMEQRFVARKGFLVREIAGEFMLVPVDTGGFTRKKREKNFRNSME